MKIPKNMRGLDRIIRVLIGVSCVYVGFIGTDIINQAVINVLIGVFGVANLFAAALAFCPAYHLAGISTLPQSAGGDSE